MTEASAVQGRSAVSRLLEEISWEGNARPYRNGGRGRENVLTTEVFSALDFLPRTAFLGGVLRAAHGAAAARAAIASTVESAVVEVLPGDISPVLADGSPPTWTVQPDVLIQTPTTLCLVEAKRIRPATFQRTQLSRTLMGLSSAADARARLVLLVTSSAPPLPVARLGPLSIEQAVEAGLHELGMADADAVREMVSDSVAWITWDEIQTVASDAATAGVVSPVPVQASIRRLARSLTTAIEWHR